MAEWEAAPKHHQPYGIVHGGVHCSVVETLASVGAATWLGEQGQVVGVNNNTDFYRAVREGRMTSTATPIHRGRFAAGLGGRDRRRRRAAGRPWSGAAAEPLPAGADPAGRRAVVAVALDHDDLEVVEPHVDSRAVGLVTSTSYVAPFSESLSTLFTVPPPVASSAACSPRPHAACTGGWPAVVTVARHGDAARGGRHAPPQHRACCDHSPAHVSSVRVACSLLHHC